MLALLLPCFQALLAHLSPKRWVLEVASQSAVVLLVCLFLRFCLVFWVWASLSIASVRQNWLPKRAGLGKQRNSNPQYQ
jgi:hypothetical protein